jgi:hypothetical protein
MAREYAKVTFYRAGSIETPTDPYVIEGDYSSVILDNVMTIASMFEFRVLNYHEEHSDQFFGGDVVFIDIGTADNHEETLGGLIFSVEYEEDLIIVKGYDWAHYLVGPRIVKSYGNIDYSEMLRQVIIQYASNLKTNFLLDSGYILQEPFVGGYNTAINILNNATEEFSYDWKVRTDREIVIMPNGLQIDFIDGFNEEEEIADPDGWTEVAGTWYVTGNAYYGSHTAVGITNTAITTADSQDIRCVVNISSGGTNDIAFIVFDYISSTDFKYAALDADNNLWIIGDYNGSFNTRNSGGSTINTGTDYRARVTIVNDTVTLYEWNTTSEIWTQRATYDFSALPEVVGVGEIGLAVNNSTISVDDFIIYSSGLQAIDVDADCISWSIAKRDFRDLINRVTVIGGKETFEDNFESGSLWQWGDFYQSGTTSTSAVVSEELEIDCEADATAIQWSQNKYKNQTFSAQVKSVDKGGGWVNTPALVFRATDDTNYYRAQLDCDNDTLNLIKVVSGTPTTLKSVAFTSAPATYYELKVKTTDDNIKVYVNSSNKIDMQDATYTTGFSGCEVIDGKAVFDDVFIITDRDVIASASDGGLIDRWGEKSADPIRDDSIKNKDSALSRAVLELNRYRFEKTRGKLKIEGDITTRTGDIIDLTALDCKITNEEYRIYGVTQIIDDAQGYITLLSVTENFPGVEDVIRVESTRGTYLSWVGILTKTLIESISDTIYAVTDSVELEDRDYRAFYFDYHDTQWGYSYFDFSTFY